ncbi:MULTISPECIES: ABC transporter ATP-binding protein [Psychrilyobacter]|uniref:ATP-binding cassette domain-containing protein n=1 Tax=Psychrilyobacter piezotolerans TaxID=2293438 RepID=A0ABX9KCW9_9FUSO|nr:MULTISPECIES: ABC transporter ATP-binding protein [Psychrilyobacter]MCS5422878.1 ABC transporter ATP-binding protein [Psychrilyobacter sp. S5]NDI79259.1 ABC transporter ATP-binding protein [Psychrilyobacter piezotolerans]RDE58821.1 ABC transporter ATP-binding protein [Psychrilyobacter sp. S5]REI39310.1 ATP-binding cassette domain-containing protein [Psychrilyobacter piezotolerans]
MENLIISNLTKGYFKKRALNNFSYSFKKGMVYGLIGPNGSGKTTLMKTIYGLVKATKGNLSINNDKISFKTRKNIAFMPTEDVFMSSLTVLQVLNFYNDTFEDFSLEKAHQILENMKLSLDEKIETFSTGMRMRLKVTLCLARNVEFYMFDEPLNGIDVISKDLIKNTIISMTTKDSTILISSHALNEMELILEQVLFLNEGSLIKDINLEELRDTENKSLESLYWEVYNV